MDPQHAAIAARIWNLFPADAGIKAPLFEIVEDESSVPAGVAAHAAWWRRALRKAATHLARFEHEGRQLYILDITTLGDERYAEVVAEDGSILCAVASPIYVQGRLLMKPGPCDSATLREGVLP